MIEWLIDWLIDWLIYNAKSEFKQKSVNSNFRKSEAEQIKSVYRRTKIMLPQLFAFAE